MRQTGIIIQARTGSSRLPNKMLLPFYEDKGIFELILQRLSESGLNVPIIVATTTKEADTALVDITNKYGFEFYRGDENNVLKRFIDAAVHFNIQNIVRLCADNPFIDVDAIKHQIKSFDNKTDYWCYCTSEKKPTIKTGYGFWTEMVTLEALKKVASQTEDSLYLEHVTNYIYAHDNQFKIHYETIDWDVEQQTDLRLTLDTIDDFQLLKEIYEHLKSNKIDFTAKAISNTVKAYPQWLEIMRAETLKNIK